MEMDPEMTRGDSINREGLPKTSKLACFKIQEQILK